MSQTAEQLAARLTGLGSSSAAPAVGLSKWQTPYQLWRLMRGIDQLSEREELFLEMGQALEPLVLRRLEKKQKISIGERQTKYVDPDWSQRWVTVDGRSERDGALIEAKSVGFADPREWGEEFEDDAVPMPYYIQAQHGLACVPDAPYTWMPVVVLNREFRVYRIRRDDETIALLTEQEKAFMRLVESGEAPPPIDLDDATLRWPGHTDGKWLMATDELAELVADFKQSNVAAKTIELQQAKLKLKIVEHMGDAAELVYAGKSICTYRQPKDSLKFDAGRFEADHPDLYARYLRPVPNARRMLTK